MLYTEIHGSQFMALNLALLSVILFGHLGSLRHPQGLWAPFPGNPVPLHFPCWISVSLPFQECLGRDDCPLPGPQALPMWCRCSEKQLTMNEQASGYPGAWRPFCSPPGIHGTFLHLYSFILSMPCDWNHSSLFRWASLSSMHLKLLHERRQERTVEKRQSL